MRKCRVVCRTWELQLWLVLLDVGQELQHPVAHLNVDHLQQALGRSAKSRRAGCRVSAETCVVVGQSQAPLQVARRTVYAVHCMHGNACRHNTAPCRPTRCAATQAKLKAAPCSCFLPPVISVPNIPLLQPLPFLRTLMATTFSKQDLKPCWKDDTYAPGLAASAATAPRLPAMSPPRSIARANAASFSNCITGQQAKSVVQGHTVAFFRQDVKAHACNPLSFRDQYLSTWPAGSAHRTALAAAKLVVPTSCARRSTAASSRLRRAAGGRR